jgi:hypothetical protein
VLDIIIVLLWKNYHDREDFFAPQRHKGHKVFLCDLCAFVVKFGCGQSRVTNKQDNYGQMI